jgi:tyrosyl-tRNA synthetase
LCGPAAASEAALHFQRVVRERGLPEEIPSCRVLLGESGSAGLLDVMRSALAVTSNAEARRLVSQGAVEVDGSRVRDATLRLSEGTYVIRAGKRRVARIRIESP